MANCTLCGKPNADSAMYIQTGITQTVTSKGRLKNYYHSSLKTVCRNCRIRQSLFGLNYFGNILLFMFLWGYFKFSFLSSLCINGALYFALNKAINLLMDKQNERKKEEIRIEKIEPDNSDNKTDEIIKNYIKEISKPINSNPNEANINGTEYVKTRDGWRYKIKPK